MSIWQVIVLAVPVLVFIALLRLIRGTSRTDLRRPVRYFDASFFVCVLCVVAFISLALSVAFASQEKADAMIPYVMVVMVLTLFAGIAFWIALGTLASRLKQSPIIWVGLSFITSPIGILGAYIWMRILVADALTGSGDKSAET